MDCPRCHLTLSDSEYEGQNVRLCGECWGYWLTRPQLDAIVQSVDYRFSRGEAKAVEFANRIGDADREGAESQPAACPECGAIMATSRYTPACPVKIDECQEHGVWLDTGEIKDLQVFVERNLR